MSFFYIFDKLWVNLQKWNYLRKIILKMRAKNLTHPQAYLFCHSKDIYLCLLFCSYTKRKFKKKIGFLMKFLESLTSKQILAINEIGRNLKLFGDMFLLFVSKNHVERQTIWGQMLHEITGMDTTIIVNFYNDLAKDLYSFWFIIWVLILWTFMFKSISLMM